MRRAVAGESEKSWLEQRDRRGSVLLASHNEALLVSRRTLEYRGREHWTTSARVLSMYARATAFSGSVKT